jgi:hypothetical protein
MDKFLIIILIIFIAFLIEYFEDLFFDLLWLFCKLMAAGAVILVVYGLYAFMGLINE